MSDISNKGKTNINMSDQEYDKAIKEEQIKFDKWYEKFLKAKTAYEISQVLSENLTAYTFSDRHPEGIKGLNKLNKFKKDKIVQLAIVKYWADSELCEKIFFKSKDKIIRLAFLENERISIPYWHKYLAGPQKSILKFLKKASDDELYAYFTNKRFDLGKIDYILNRNNTIDAKYANNPYNKISEKMYRNIILILENNPNTKTEPEMKYDSTGYSGMVWALNSSVYEKFKKELVKIKKLKNLE